MFLIFLIAVLSPTITKCHDLTNSIEVNGIEVSPFYETIILKDVADTLNEFDSNKGFDTYLKNESESEEDVEDLLSEYQHYLDRAHKQIRTYIEKSKPKNKVPLLRREKFIKPRLNPNDHQDIIFPLSTRIDNLPSLPFPPRSIHEILNIPKMFFDELRPINVSPLVDDGPAFLCPCKSSEDCLRCPRPFDKSDSSMVKQDDIFDAKQDPNDGNMNIRVNVDIEMPKLFLEMFGKMAKHLNQDQSVENFAPKSSNLSSPLLNFPIPMRFFGNRRPKLNQNEFIPLRKITIHKKKKSKLSNGKKHHKKVITLHKLEPQRSIQNIFMPSLNISDLETTDNKSGNTDIKTKLSNATEEKINTSAAPVPIKTEGTAKKAEAQTISSIYLMVNISNNLDEIQNLTNSVESDLISNKTADKLADKVSTPGLRRKRQVLNETAIPSTQSPVKQNKSEITKIETVDESLINKKETVVDNETTTSSVKNITLDIDITKLIPILKKNSTYEKELSYWPISINNSIESSSNITSLILDRENKKAKLNITKDMVRNNHTEALEHAIFGKVDWNDVDAVAPMFLSFMGKYITGALTFCSDLKCHSMKCEEKSCILRLCPPDQRYNKIGHCTAGNSTDSVISMESIMDLPTNMAFEIVDILENKMLGRVYGKATLCIGPKCITFVASKKNFYKSRCSNKELNAVGHCTNIKNVKLL